MKTGAQILCESLLREGVEVIFGISGGTVIPMYDAFSEYPQIRRVLVRHEQAAAHAAAGYARARQKAGVCVATSGPGATNLVTGIADAYMDSTPMVVITGQVSRSFIGKDAFQETDITGITLPIVKHNYLVREAASIARVVKEAFHIAQTGRPGPVLIDIPKDVQQEYADFSYPDEVKLPGYHPTMSAPQDQVMAAAELVNRAERPFILAGRGVLVSHAYDELMALAETLQAPVANTMLGLGSFPPQHRLSVGMLGMHGAAYANLAAQNADLVLAIGTRFVDRTTMKTSEFAPKAVVVHIDISPAEINKNVVAYMSLVGDAKNVLAQLNPLLTPRPANGWLKQVFDWRERHPLTVDTTGPMLSARAVIRRLFSMVDKQKTLIVTGVGQHQMFAAQEYVSARPNGFISSGGHGTMGFELPAALGAQIACPDEAVWVVAGDGGFQMTMQELSTIVQERLPVKMAIISNGYLGMVRQWQDLFCDKNYVDVGIHRPDFVKLVDAYGIPGMHVTKEEQVGPAIEQAMACDGPFLLNFEVEPEENVFPMCAPGSSISEMLGVADRACAPRA
jgi:acetolactate synthase-1/2/3 large subunit